MSKKFKKTKQSIPIRPNTRKTSGDVGKKPVSNTRWYCVFLAILSFVIYSNILNNGYALDDIGVLTSNKFVTQGIHGIPAIMSTPHLSGFIIAPNETYRPLSLAMFAIMYEVFGANPGIGHFVNILLFAGCVVLLFLFLDGLFDKKRTNVAFAAAVLFSVHPIHTEVVANIKSADELLCFFFSFLSLNIFIRYMDTGKIFQLMLGIGALFLAFISKETAIIFIGIAPLTFYFYKNENRTRAARITAGSVIATILFITLRAYVLKINNNYAAPVHLMDNALTGAPGGLSRLATELMILGNYLKLLLVPYPLSCDYSFNSIHYINITNLSAIIPLTIYLSGAGITIYLLFKKDKNPWAYAILFYLVSIALFSNIVFMIGSAMSERFTFFASVGICLLAGLGIDYWISRTTDPKLVITSNIKMWSILVPVLLVYGTLTYNRNKDWKDNYTLYSTDLKKNADNSRLNFCVGYELVEHVSPEEKDPVARKQLLADGIEKLRRALAIHEDYSAAQCEIGNAFYKNRQYDSAELHDQLALKINPNDREAINNLAGIYFEMQKYPQALLLCKRALELNPSYVDACYNTGLCYLNMKRYDSALTFLQRSITIDHLYTKSYKTIAITYNLTGETDSARKYAKIAKNYDPSFQL